MDTCELYLGGGKGPPERRGGSSGTCLGLQVTHKSEYAITSLSSPGHPRSVPQGATAQPVFLVEDDCITPCCHIREGGCWYYTWGTRKEPALRQGENGLIKSMKVLNWDFVFKISQMDVW